MEQHYNVLLYYCYTAIEDPAAFREEHHRYCLDHGLRGRIIVAPEGINGTLSGYTQACETYMQMLKADPRFAHTHFKVAPSHQHAFQKLYVRVKPEIVYAGLPHINPNQRTGEYVDPQALQQMRQKEDVVLVDVRSNYEHQLGKFKDAITLDINHFRQFADQVERLMPYKDKKIVTYCTGGIRCEKASAYLLEKGFEKVYQLYGGILHYSQETDGEDFEGKCYVFDNRLATDINKKNPSVISQCYSCHQACDRMVNCANSKCNLHIPLCEACAHALDGACSTTCQQHPAKRPYDGTGCYTRTPNGYNPYQSLRRKGRALAV